MRKIEVARKILIALVVIQLIFVIVFQSKQITQLDRELDNQKKALILSKEYAEWQKKEKGLYFDEWLKCIDALHKK